MLECPFAVDIWRASPLEWALLIAQNLVKSDFDCIIMLFWVIWKTMNAKLWGEVPNPNPMVDFLRVACSPSQSVSHGVPPRWSCPPTEQCLGGVGIIIKNAKGNFVGAAYRVFMEVFSPIQVEALVM
ncbi:hypothetical protein D8674_036511 [Pyrus ussuriensis x Pyrus communis]|uniref:RNase H type-1 domain-containing protein n=1 Tax=Pyrus ussuriensis x Pyrus communis TaxID=2448454 RepID=A0A5N5H637_9ROSA|nr:hypothetical protein D8674_036511 [Pyrus ussuriensis x Pyrus communis]